MPYTPPSSRSPASSTPTSPDVSRRPSFHQSTNGSRPVLPRSASYLTKHRRTPSAVSINPRPTNQLSPEATSEDLKAMLSPSVRQSPPPVTGELRIPNCAIMSPPDSSSDDEDLPELRSQARGRQAGDLKALHEAISQISQDRSSSPSKATTAETGTSDARDMVSVASHASATSEGMHHSLSTGSLDEIAAGGNRKPTHARSNTEPDLQRLISTETSLTGSEEDSDEDAQRKPQMVRKKSGELVRPALRPPSRRRPSSMPGTPTFSKAVHFDSHLEHVRHFLQVDRPLAVSAGSSPAENYDSDREYPFTGDGRSAVGSPPFEWEIVMNNFPLETPARKAQPVRLDRVWLSNDQKCLTGSVVVANLAFQKFVTCRFTLDYWKTTSEVAAEYSCEVRPVQQPIGRDRFQFTIKLSDMANLESKTLYFCIRYNVNGQEYWDNNGGMNFQADFQKKMLPQNGKKGTIGAASRPANGLPKSTRRSNPSTAPRPKSMPVGVDDFLDNPKLNFDQSLHDYLGEPAPASLRLKGVKSSSSLPSDNLPSRLSAPSGQAFANRYDFGASLTAAIQNAKDQLFERPDGLYMKSSRKPSAQPSGSSKPTGPGSSSPIKNLVPGHMKSSTVPGMDSPSPSIASASYEELVNKYCFFGSKQPSRPQVNGTDDASKSTTNSSATSSCEGSPVQMGNYRHYHSGTQHHSLHPRDPSSSYFYHSTSFVPIGASPAESPLQGFSSQQAASPLGNPPRSTAPPDKAANQSSTPASSLGDFAHLTGTSPNDYAYQHMHDRFPFSGGDAHAATAIRG